MRTGEVLAASWGADPWLVVWSLGVRQKWSDLMGGVTLVRRVPPYVCTWWQDSHSLPCVRSVSKNAWGRQARTRYFSPMVNLLRTCTENWQGKKHDINWQDWAYEECGSNGAVSSALVRGSICTLMSSGLFISFDLPEAWACRFLCRRVDAGSVLKRVPKHGWKHDGSAMQWLCAWQMWRDGPMGTHLSTSPCKNKGLAVKWNIFVPEQREEVARQGVEA